MFKGLLGQVLEKLGIEDERTRKIFIYSVAKLMEESNLLEVVKHYEEEGREFILYREVGGDHYFAIERPGLTPERELLLRKELAVILKEELGG